MVVFQLFSFRSCLYNCAVTLLFTLPSPRRVVMDVREPRQLTRRVGAAAVHLNLPITVKELDHDRSISLPKLYDNDSYFVLVSTSPDDKVKTMSK